MHNSEHFSCSVEASPETAVLGDYLLPNGDVTFSPGTKRQEVTFTVVQDNFVEATETFTATLKEIGSKVRVVSPDKTKIYIYDDDSMFFIIIIITIRRR